MMTMAVVSLALLIDLLCGEPPNRFHPVAWMGLAIAWARRRAPVGHAAALLWGAAIVLVGAAVSAAVGWVVLLFSQSWLGPAAESAVGFWAAAAVQAVVLKSCLGVRSLASAAGKVQRCLANGDLDAARTQLGYHLVSRPVQRLSPAEVSAATIESVAENTSDSVIGPLFFFLLGGLPAALAYRFVNTSDAMLGYRTESLRWLGKVPARTDDVLNLIPARLTAALMTLALLPAGETVRRTIRVWRRDHGRTPSPNGGHPMSVAAGALGVCLAKSGHYLLGEGLRVPSAADIQGMQRLYRRTILLAVMLVLLGGGTMILLRPHLPASNVPTPTLSTLGAGR